MFQQNDTGSTLLTAVLDFLRAHAGTAFTVEELCQQTGCTPVQIRIALNLLLREEVVQKERSVSGSDRYVWGMT